MADDSDDELFKFASSKPNLQEDTDLDYYEHLLKDADNNDGEDLPQRGGGCRKRPATGGLAEQLMAGKVEKRMRTAGENDDVLEVNSSTKTLVRNDSSPERRSNSSSPLNSYSPGSYITSGYIASPVVNDYEARRLMDSIDDTLYSLRREYPSLDDSESFDLDNITSCDRSFNLRVRCRGVTHTFEILESDPLSVIFAKLSSIYDDNNILLQLKSAEVKSSDTVITLGLSTVDILDAFVLDKVAGAEDPVSISGNAIGKINIKIQTSKKAITYLIDTNEPLARVMKDFAGQLNVEVRKIKFTFDGEAITGRSSAQSLDMEDSDIIDAVV